MYRKAYEVVGYATECGSVYCVDCVSSLEARKRGYGAIIRSSEWDYAPICEDCGEELEVNIWVGYTIKYEEE